MTSPLALEQHSQTPVLKTTDRPGTWSKVAGAGAGTGWILAAQKFGLNEAWTLALESVGPWLAVGISIIGPYISAFIMNKLRLRGLKSIIAEAEAQVKGTPEGSQSRAVAEANLEQVRQMINENLIDTASIFHNHRPH
jgi:hypothetical protein